MRENELTELPEELGQLEELTVLDVVGNRYGGGGGGGETSTYSTVCVHVHVYTCMLELSP